LVSNIASRATEATSATATQSAEAGDMQPANSVQLATLSLGHAVVDSYGHSLLAPLFPVLAERLDLGLDEIGGLPLMMGLSAALGQPLIGLVTDRWRRIPAVALGPAIAAVFVGLVGFARSYTALAALLFLAGLGIAAYHPQGASLASVAARGRALAISGFTVGGNIGFGVAPLLGAMYFAWFGLERFYLASIPGVVFAALLLCVTRRPSNRLLTDGEPSPAVTARDHRPGALALLTATVTVRAAVQIAVGTFLAFLLRERWPGSGTTAAGVSLAVFLLANAVSGPVGGHLTDRFGRRSVMIASLAAAPFVFSLALELSGYWLIAGLALGGFVLMLPHPANVVMAQEYLPARTGMAASMITGLAWGVGQFFCWPLGAVAERVGVGLALHLVCWLPLLGILLVLPLRDLRTESDLANLKSQI
jgi:FSR family fosmidomycin resistance protein-like MFS transporter